MEKGERGCDDGSRTSDQPYPHTSEPDLDQIPRTEAEQASRTAVGWHIKLAACRAWSRFLVSINMAEL